MVPVNQLQNDQALQSRIDIQTTPGEKSKIKPEGIVLDRILRMLNQ